MAFRPLASRTNDAVVLPARLQCERCSKTKPQIQFNDKELEKLKDIVVQQQSGTKNPAATTRAVCDTCQPSRIGALELECLGCDRWLAIDRFSKQMRKTPDTAYCWDCSEDRQNLKPATRFDDEDDNDFRAPGEGSSGGESDDDVFGGGTTVAAATSTMGAMSLSGLRGGGVALSSTAPPTSSGCGTPAAAPSPAPSRPSTSRGPASATTKPLTGGSNTWPALAAAGKKPAQKSIWAQPPPPPAARSQVKAPKPVLGGPRHPLDEVAVEDSDDEKRKDDK